MSVPNFVISFMPDASNEEQLLIVLVLFFFALLLAFLPVAKLLRYTVSHFLYLDAGGYWDTICFLPLMIFAGKYVTLGGEHNVGGIAQLFSSAMTAATMICLCVNIAADHKRLSEKQDMERMISEQKNHYAKLQSGVEHARKSRHDLKHHIAAIRNMADKGDCDGVCSYCDDLLVSSSVREWVPYSGNVAADGVLFHYMQRAADEGIEMECLGTLNSRGIADMDLCVLIGNALDNALTACMKLRGNKCIQIISQSEERLLSVMIRNSYDGQIKKGSKGLLSLKRENGYGVGLSSMRSVCEKYGGSFDTAWDSEYFTVLFILPLKDE